MFHSLKNRWFFVVSLLSLPCLWLYYTPNMERQKIHIFLIMRGALNRGKALIFHNRVWVVVFDTNWKIKATNNVFVPYFYNLLYIISYKKHKTIRKTNNYFTSPHHFSTACWKIDKVNIIYVYIIVFKTAPLQHNKNHIKHYRPIVFSTKNHQFSQTQRKLHNFTPKTT